MGVLGFLKVLIASPLTYFRIGGGGGRGRTTGRDRYEQVSWIIILVGVGTFLAVCIPVKRTEISKLLNKHRQSTRVSVFGVVARLKELASVSWTFRATMMSIKTSSYAMIAI